MRRIHRELRLPRGRATRVLLVVAMLLGLVAGTTISPSAADLQPSAFELDGNPQDNPSGGADDWANIYSGTHDASATTGVVADPNGVSIFTGGSTKDDLDITGWQHTNGSVPPKDELLNAYAARYGDVLYFGTDRYTTNGSAQIGFWFFQQQVGPVTGGGFSGQHVDGDILVLSNFTNGGSQPNVRVFRWNAAGGDIPGAGAINGTLDLLAGSTDPALTADCNGVNQSSAGFCATVSTAALPTGTPSPWPYQSKDGGPNIFPPGGFFEGGIDLAFLDLEDECFSSFITETRSSPSTDAVLKDFVHGSFPSCQASLSTTPSVGSGATVTPGQQVTDTLTVTGSGISNPPTPTGNVDFYLCGPTATDSTALCESTTTKVGATKSLSGSGATATATSDPVNTAGNPLTPGRYCFLAIWAGDTNYPAPTGGHRHNGVGNAECFVVDKIVTQTVTTPVDGSGTAVTQIVLGNTLSDRAVVTGTAAGGDPTGNVSFFVCSPTQLDDPSPTDDPATCDVGGTAVTGNPKTLTSDGVAGTYTASAVSGAVTPTSTGTWCFRADYAGNSVYFGSSDSATTECVSVIKLPTGTVTTPSDAQGQPDASIVLGESIRDKAVVTGSAGGGDPTGTVSFFVCSPSELDDPGDPTDSTGTCDVGGRPSPATRRR